MKKENNFKISKLKGLVSLVCALAAGNVAANSLAQSSPEVPIARYMGKTKISLKWDHNNQPDMIDGFQVFFGGERRQYTNTTDVGYTNILQFTNGFPLATAFYFAVTAYKGKPPNARIESDISEEVPWFEVETESAQAEIVDNMIRVSLVYLRPKDAPYHPQFQYQGTTNDAPRQFIRQNVTFQESAEGKIREKIELYMQDSLPSQVLITQRLSPLAGMAVAPVKFRVRKL